MVFMASPPPGRKRRFHDPVVASSAGGPGSAAILSRYLAALPSSTLGTAAEVISPGANCLPADVTWDARVRSGRVHQEPAATAMPANDGACSDGGKTRPGKRPRTRGPRAAPSFDDDNGDAEGACAPPCRSATRGKGSSLSKEVMDALSACVRRACGRPSTTRVGRGKSVGSATLIGDPLSRSRAIVLRLGSGKHDQAVLWSSKRGGVLCSCFTGTQNALFLSISSRSSTCKHAGALLSCLSTAGIPLVEFWQRMHLGSAPKDFVCRLPHSSSAWVVLFRSVYSLVSFSAANVATCIAPSCRRFRARCGHVAMARPFNDAQRADVAVPTKERTASTPKVAAASDGAGLQAGLPDEDAGIEMEQGDTERGSEDAAEATVAARVRRNLLPCVGEVAAGEVWARTADWKGMLAMRSDRVGAVRAADVKRMSTLFHECAKIGHVNEDGVVYMEPYCGSCGCRREERHEVTKDSAVLYTHHPSAPSIRVCHSCCLSLVRVFLSCGWRRSAWCGGGAFLPMSDACASAPLCHGLVYSWCSFYPVQIIVGRWTCDCERLVEYDGSADALFCLRRRNKSRQWVVFTRAILDKLYSFIISARSTYTAATRHLSADMLSFSLRRQDVVKVGTDMLRTFVIPPDAAVCPLCGPNPEFIVIDGQALGCTDPDDVNPERLEEEVPVLDIPASALCVVQSPSLRAAIAKVLKSSVPLTGPQTELLRSWHQTVFVNDRASVETASARVFFHFFPFEDRGATYGGNAAASGPAGASVAQKAATSVAGEASVVSTGLEAKLRTDGDDNLTLGGKGAPAKLPSDSWRDRVGHCAPDFVAYSKNDGGAWLHIRPFLQAFLGETVSGMFHGHDEKAARLLANCLRLQVAGKWRDVSGAVDGIGFLANFLGWFAPVIDEVEPFRHALGTVLLCAVDMEDAVDQLFSTAANKKETIDRGSVNAEYCRKWGGLPTPADYQRWRAGKMPDGKGDMDDPLVSFESFPALDRVRPGIRDTEALKRRVGYKGKDRHAADVEGDGDACNKAFSIKCGLTQGVFNVVCPHVVTLGFRCLFRAESVGEALSIVLERFPSLPKVIFYDVACKLDKNALRRVRPILRRHGVRCILDRPHSITHTCSPIYMPDESLGATAGVATQAAEVSHSIAVANRTSLAYMAPKTYMVHKMVQVAMMNIRKLQRMASLNTKGENDHVALAPFYHSQIARSCQRGSACSCQASIVDNGVRETEAALRHKVDGTDGTDDRFAAEHPVAGDTDGQVKVVDDETLVEDAVVVDSDGDAAAVFHPALSIEDVSPDGGRSVNLEPFSTTPLSDGEAAGLELLAAGRAPGTLVRPRNTAKILLTVADFRRFEAENWLNDSTMNSLVALINVRAKQVAAMRAAGVPATSTVPRTFMFNTHFFSRLRERAGLYDYAGVRRWGFRNGLDIGAVDRILIPVNMANLHWVLVLIDVKHRQLIFFDSLRGQAAPTLATVRRWLEDEVGARLGTDAAEAWDIASWEGVVDLGSPRQADRGSCGVFVMAAADCFSLGAPLSFCQRDIPVLRQRMSVALFVDSLTALNGCESLPDGFAAAEE